MKLAQVKNALVVPFDFSEMSCEALQEAIRLAGDQSLIRVIHVTEYATAYEYGVVWETVGQEVIVNRLKDSFAEKMENLGLTALPDFKVSFGNPGVEICKYADSQNAELIVMPSHGRSGLTRFLLGSVTERVIRSANCPVLVLKAEDKETDVEAVGELGSATV